MTGIKMARIRKCQKCEQRSTRHASIDSWPRCKANNNAYIDDAFLESGSCPLGLWGGLVPVDLEAEAAAALVVARTRKTAYWGGVLGALYPQKLTAADAETQVDSLVAANVINDPVVAANVKEGVTKVVAEI